MKKNFFGQPKEIIFCKKCVESNQRFVSSVQHKIIKNQVKDTALFDNQGVCYSCKFFEEKEKINWDDREKEFSEILEKFRKNDGSYDVLIPGYNYRLDEIRSALGANQLKRILSNK